MAKDPKILIHYWSATGNTKLAAQLAAESLREAGAAVSVADIRDNDASKIKDLDLWIIATPVYDFRPALPVEDFLNNLPSLDGIKVAAILTCSGFSDRTPTILANAIRRRGGIPWDLETLICEDSWPIARRYLTFIARWDEPTKQTQEDFKAFWRAVPGRLNANDSGRSWWRFPTPLTLCAPFYNRSLVKHWFRIWVDQEKCTGCGICSEKCPTGRMKIPNFPNPPGDCIGCYGCVNVCPVDAVDTWLTKGAPRYGGPKTDQSS